MVSSPARTPREYLDSLPEERRDAIAALRSVILDNLPAGFEEAMQYGMLSYQVPLAVYPDTYNGQAASVACLASQKQHMSLYLMCVYGDPDRRRRFEKGFKQAGKKLDMGKSCVRFKRVEDLPLNVIGDAIAAVSMEEFVSFMRRAQAERTFRPKAKAKAKAKARPVALKKAKPVAKASAKLRRAARGRSGSRRQ